VNLLVLGPQGAGKGTQAKRVSSDYAIPHVSTGDMFREAVASGSELGERVKPILESGALVPDDLTVGLIQDRLANPDALRGFILDGFPRNAVQAEVLDQMLASIGRRLDAVLFLDLPDEVATERMLARAEIENRPDDTPDVIEKRLETYHEQTEPIVEHYRAAGVLVPLHAERTIDEVYAEIQDALDRLEGNAS
jgi:adenylate kinase